MKKLHVLAAGAICAFLAACSGGGNTTVPTAQSPQSTGTGAAAMSQAQRGLWPRSGPAQRVCGTPSAGTAECAAWIRTDIQGSPAAASPSGYTPSDLQTAYNLLTASKGGSGITVAIVDAFDDPNAESDLAVYRSQFGLPACTTANGCFSKVVLGRRTNTGWAEEESLDVDMEIGRAHV